MADAKFTVDYSDIKALHAQLGKTSKEFQNMVRSVDPVVNATETFSRKVDLLNSEFKESERNGKLYQRTLENIRKQAHAAGVTMDRFGNIQAVGGKNAKHFQLQIQQAGYQVGDFFTQVAMGQNPIMAFSTQMSQLAGFFSGPWGAAIGAGISILGALTIAFMNAGGGAKSLDEAVGDLEDAMSSYFDAMVLAKSGVQGLTDEFGLASPTIRQVVQDLAMIERSRAYKALDDLGESLNDALDGFEGRYQNTLDLLQNPDLGTGLFSGALSKETQNVVTEFDRLTDSLQSSADVGTKLQNALALRDLFLANVDASKGMTDEQEAFFEAVVKTIQNLELLQNKEEVVADTIRKAAAERSANASAAAKDYADTLQSYREEIQLSQAILEYGKDSAQVADVKRQHYLASVTAAAAEATEVEAARQAMIDLAMEAYDAKIAIDNSADAAARMGEGFNAAIDKIRQMTSEINGFYGALHAGGLDVSALEAQLTALQGGATTAQAAGEALRTQLMGSQLAKDILSGGSVGEQATFLAGVNQRVADEVRRRELQASIGEFGKTSSRSGGKTEAETLQDNLDKLLETLATQELLNGKTDAQRQIIQALGSNYQAVDATILEALEQKINKQAELNREIEKQQSIADTIQSSMSDAFMSMVDGTKSAKDAFRDMARDIIKQLYDVLVVQQLVGSWNAQTGTGTGLAGMIMGAFQADGGVWSSGRQVNAFANGGVVSGPTMFPMAGGQTGLMGEAGPEAIMPLKRGPDGKLGVHAGGQGSVNIVQNFSFSANGDDSVKRIIAQAAPQIAQMTQKQIMDSRRRGGQMKATFS